MRLRLDRDADRNIYELLLSWRPSTCLILMLFALVSVTPITLFIYKLIYNFYYVRNFYNVAYYASLGFYHFSFINARFGGFILLIFFLTWKDGTIADIILTSPGRYHRIKINNVWLRAAIYFTVIIGLGFIIHGLKILLGTTSQPFTFPTGLYDFSVRMFFAPISEEIYFRFLILYITAVVFGRIPAVFISTFFFTISHDFSQPFDIMWITIIGLVNSLSVISFGTLWPAIGLHIINNILAYFSHPF